MSKSMWIDAVEMKPVTDKDPDFSVEVLYWVEGHKSPIWGYFNFRMNRWCHGILREIYSSDVKYFAYIDNPYK